MSAPKKTTAPIPPPLPMQYSLLAGAVAGVTEILAMYPLDVVKTRFQLHVGQKSSDSILKTFRTIIREEGFSRLYRGIIPPILVEAPKRAIKFGANDQYTRIYKQILPPSFPLPLAMVTGVSAGCTEALVVVSFDLVKIRLQDKANAGRYKNTIDCVAKIFKEEGPLAFFKGLEATLWRHGVWNGGYFGVIGGVRSALPEPETPKGLLLKNFVAGTIGGTVGTLLNTPFDVAKTRIQNQVHGLKYNWTLPALKTIVQEEGFGALYKGFIPKVLRLGPGGGILLVVFDGVSSLIRKHLM